MTKLFFPALRRCRLVAVLSLLTAVASGQPDQAGPSAVLVPGMTSLPEPTLVMIDGRENEIFTRRPTFVPGMDIINVHLSHLGGDNFLWRIDFLEPPAFDEGVFNFYLDLDLDVATGIQAVEPEAKTGPPPPLAGADLSVTFSQNKCTQQVWNATGAAGEQREIPFYIRNRELYFRTELALPAKQGRVSLAIAANTHSIVTPEKPNPVMRDTTRRLVIHRFELKSEKAVPDALDSDGDGIPDAVEAIFGTRPDRPDSFTTLATSPLLPAERRAKPTYVAGMDMTEIAVAHVAEDRFIFRTTFAAPPPLADMVHIIYLDTDNSKVTGRDMGADHPGTGTDVMLFMVAGKASISLHGDVQKQYPSSQIRHALVGNHLYLCADLPLEARPDGAAFGMFSITHTAGTPKPPMNDSISRVDCTGIPLVSGAKQPFGDGWTGTAAMHRAYGLNLIRPLLSRPDCVVIPYDKLELAGFDIDYYTSRQYGHLKALRPRAAAGHTAPKGRFHVGFMIFDRMDGSDIGLRINNHEIARARINAGNLNYWIYWLPEARDFTGAEYVELVALGGNAPHPICSLFFSPEVPPQREQSTAVDNLTIYIPPATVGEALVSWTSENLVPARLEYGIGNFEQVFTEPRSMLVHKAHLTGLDPAQTYQARAVGIDADGSPVYSQTVTFQPQPKQPPATRAGRHRVPLAVANPHPFPAENWLIRSGVPFPQGVLADASQTRLLHDGRETPAQIAPAAWWPDGSIQWLTITFAASAPPQETTEYVLEYGQEVKPTRAAGADLATPDADDILIQTGASSFRVNAAGELVLPDGKPVRTRIATAGDNASTLATGELPATVILEENGPVYARVRSSVTFPDAAGQPALTIICRIEAWRGAKVAKLSHSFLVQGQPSHSTFESIDLEVPVASSGWVASRLDGPPLTFSQNDRAFQRREHELIVNQAEPIEARLLGDFIAGDSLVVLRHYWEQYPKGVSVAGDLLRLELCPDFEAGYYDSFPFNKHSTKIHFYLHDGVYKFRRGLRKTHELLIGTGGAAEAALFQRPLLATAPPTWYCDSKAFYEIAPRDPENFPTYEAHADRNFATYRRQREARRDYGMLNFGDWFGERGVHWGNSEYDNTATFLLQYVRSGDQECFFLADEAEKHVRDVDMKNWDPNPLNIGHVYIHQVGHHGGYYDRSPPGEDAWGTGSGGVTHAWSEGHLWHGFLTGDSEAIAAGLNTVDYYIATRFNRFYDFCDLRDPGWHLIMNAAAYQATLNPVYLNASRVIIARVLEFQDKIPRPLPEHQVEPGRTHQVGGWSRMMVPGHCHCEPRHRGNANFMIAVLLSGLKYYYATTGDPAVKASLIAGAYYLLDECYSEDVGGFRYTSCPAMRYSRNVSPILTEGIATAFRWTGDQRLAHPLIHGLPANERGSAYGNAYYYRCGPRILADMKAAGLKWDSGMAVPTEVSDVFKKPQWLEKAKNAVVVQAEDFSRQGGGECQKIGGRPGAWGQIVSYWHADIGHWLEWEVDIPEDGDYAVRFHYATSSPETRRDFLINGQLPCPQAENITFPATGGFGTNPFDWNYRSLVDAEKKDLAIPLRKGRHTIRMINKNDGLAFDFFVLFQP